MNIKKITAAVVAAAVLTVAAPMTGVLPDTLSVVAHAADYAVGDVFYVAMNPVTGDAYGEGTDYMTAFGTSQQQFSGNGAVYCCKMLSDGTIGVYTDCMGNEFLFRENKISIPSQIGGYTVTEIGTETGAKCIGGFSSITIPDTVTTINQSAFCWNFYLEEVVFDADSQLKLIDEEAFEDCRSLKSITIPASVETIAYGAFMNTKQTLTTREGVDFTNTYSLESVNFAEGSRLTLIDQWAFQSQRALTSIMLPDSLEKIGYGAFLGCTSLTTVTIPENVDEIGDGAFSCTGSDVMSIVEINVVENNNFYKSVGGILFTKDGETLVSFPKAKSGSYTIPAGVNTISDGAFGHSTKLTSVTIPEGVTDIPENAFTYCTSLTEVNLPSTLTTIGQWGFEACAFTSIDIPESVTSIDAHAFDSTPLKNINGVAGSYAETFANENGYTFNGEGEITFGGEDTEGVQVIANSKFIPEEAHFQVQIDDSLSNDTRIAYNCFFTYNGAEYEPTDTVTVRIPVPVAMRDIANTLKVYHLQDGRYVSMNAVVENGYLVFETDHFSIYVVTAQDLSDEVSYETGSDVKVSDYKPANGDTHTELHVISITKSQASRASSYDVTVTVGGKTQTLSTDECYKNVKYNTESGSKTITAENGYFIVVKVKNIPEGAEVTVEAEAVEI